MTTPPQLARFPAEVLDAYARYRTRGDAAAVRAVALAAVGDYTPTRAAQAAGEIPTGQSRLVADLGFDSVAIAELVFFFEDLFDLTITNQEIQDIRTVDDLCACLERKLAERSAGP